MKTELILLLLGLTFTGSAFSAPAESTPAEPAGFLLLVLGLAALLLGLKSLRDLRHKRFLPPRAARRRKSDRDNSPASER